MEDLDLSRGSVELYLSRQDGRHVVQYRDRLLELGTVRAVIDLLGDALDELDDGGDDIWSVVDFGAGEVELIADHDRQQLEMWGEVLDLDDARDLLDALGEALDTADEHELGEPPDDDD